MEMTTRMRRINKRLALAASLTAIVVGLATGVAFAAGDTDDNISPGNTSITATNSTNIVFKLTVNGIAVTITCTNADASWTTPASGLGPVNLNNPSVTGCRDTVGGADTITTNSTNGHWQLTFIDAANDESQGEPNSGDELQVTIPKAGAIFKLSVLNCVITLAPTGPVNVRVPYDDVSTLTSSNVSIPAAGCGVTTVTITGTFKVTTGFHDVS